MKKQLFFVMLMGVFTLQSCIKYRIKEIDHGSMKYYEPEKRTFFSWEHMQPHVIYDLTTAKERIDSDKNRRNKKFLYIKY
jgi:hypothetical protein